MQKPKVLFVGKPSNLGNALMVQLSASGYQIESIKSGDKIKKLSLGDYRFVVWFAETFTKLVLHGDTKIFLILPTTLFTSTREVIEDANITTIYVGSVWNTVQLTTLTKQITKILFSFGSGRHEFVFPVTAIPLFPKKVIEHKKLSWKWGYIALAIFLLPYILFCLTLPSFYVAYKNIRSGNFDTSQRLLTFNSGLLTVSNQIFSLYDAVPVIGRVFDSMLTLSQVADRSAQMGKSGIDAIKTVKELTTKIMGKEIYSPSVLCNDLVLDLDYLYNQAVLLQGDINVLPTWQKNIIYQHLPESTFTDMETKLNWGRTFSRQLPAILGEGTPQSYLVLLQNNMELRATGGFIGSFAVINMDGGRLTDMNVMDVYSADGQLKGHVEPPAPIKNYLGQAAWYLRDSNWDPDFPSSATKAEWFLEKEIGKSVSGVVAVDLETAKSILAITGPITLTDYGLTINQSNLYARTQDEVENDFFPGSTQKSSFLTDLTKELLTRVSTFKPGDDLSLFKSLNTNLQEKHIQVFLHNKDAQKFVEAMGYDGAVVEPMCSDTNCYADWLGMVDANVGVNKSNLFISRDSSLKVDFSGGKMVRTLSINYDNKATPALGDKAQYKTYTRVLIPQGANIEYSNLASYGESAPLQFDRQEIDGRSEIGVLIEIMPGDKKTWQISWSTPNSLDLSQAGEYRLYVRKQAGTLTDPIAIEIGDKDQYNTTLSQDLFRTVTW
jgi:hypothetical protein